MEHRELRVPPVVRDRTQAPAREPYVDSQYM